MARYMFIYKGDATDMAEMTPEQGAEVMAAWEAWMGQVGSALVDVGSPFGPSSCVVDDGSIDTPSAASGYTIVEAPDMASAEALTAGHPYLTDDKGDFAIDIYELLPVPI